MGTYEALKAAGHSPSKAAEIALDARRGDAFARQWIELSAGFAPDHFHCLDGCGKAIGEQTPAGLMCVACGAPFVPCTPEICHGARR